jgi:hypothetical protein
MFAQVSCMSNLIDPSSWRNKRAPSIREAVSASRDQTAESGRGAGKVLCRCRMVSTSPQMMRFALR